MAKLAPLLPPHLLKSLAKRFPKKLPHAEKFQAALLVADLSGFTALTEKLQAKGRQGAEEIASVIHQAFRPAIRAIEERQGSIVSFGGDALFAMFLGAGGVRRALAAAEVVRDAVDKTSTRRARLGVSQAIHWGQVSGLHIGSGDRRHYLVGGPSVASVVRLEQTTASGEILLSAKARPRLARERTPSSKPTAAVSLGQAAIYLEPKIPKALEGFRGEYRRAAILFLETRGLAARKMQAWFGVLIEVLEKYDGMLLKSDNSSVGHKWICLFGIPSAHERDSDRAARAAIDLLAAVPSGLSLRGGLHAGTVVNILIGTRARRSFDIMGDVVNTAARAMAKAECGEVLVTEACRKTLLGVETEDRGEHSVKGKSQALHLYALASAGLGVKQICVSAPMVGRATELAAITDALERAQQGHGCVIGIKGEAGIGKSRLKYEAASRARQMGVRIHEGRAITFGGMAYWTISSLLRDALGIPDVAGKEVILDAVTSAADDLGLTLIDRHHLAEVLGARYPDSQIEHLEPQDVRQNNMIAMRLFSQALADERPTLLVLEDMQWADGASIEAVEWLAKGARGKHLVLLLLYRPGSYVPPADIDEIRLVELAKESVDGLLQAHLGVVSDTIGALVRERSGGNPFYVEELVRHLLESGFLGLSEGGYLLLREPGPEDLPDSVETLIAARLDGVSREAKNVAQHAAVIGRSFLFELLTHFPGIADSAKPGVDELAGKELVFLEHPEPQLEYIFKHALTRDVAYASVLMSRRRRLHRVLAEAIEVVHGSAGFEAMLGHHWERAGQAERARAAYLAGARVATDKYAHDEAERLYGSYFGLAKRPTAESVAARLEFGKRVLQLLGRVTEAEAECGRAREEARKLGERMLEGGALHNLATLHMGQGRMGLAREGYEGALAIAREVGALSFEGEVLGNLANQYWERGRTEEARGLFEQGLAILRAVGDRRREGIVLGNLAGLHKELGKMDEGRALYEQALTIVREVGDRRCEGIFLGNLANLNMEQGRLEEARRLYGEALTIHREVGNRSFVGLVLGSLASLQHSQGRTEEAREGYEEALAIHREVGKRRDEGIVLGNLANLHHRHGRMEEAREGYEEALVVHREVGNRRGEGIVLGNLAGLSQEQGRMEEAREGYEEALAVHREVGNRRGEGLVLGYLANIHMEQGRMEEAKEEYAGALAIARELESRVLEGYLLASLAKWHLIDHGVSRVVRQLASDAERVLDQVNERLQLGKLICSRGHIALASSDNPGSELTRARDLAIDLGANPDSEIGRAIAMLERAQQAFESGRPLVRGYDPEDLTPGQLRWLRQKRTDAIPPDIIERLDEQGSIGNGGDDHSP